MLPYIYPFGVQMPMYQIMMLVGFIGMIVSLIVRRNEMKFSLPKAAFAATLLLISGMIGAKVMYIILNWDYVQANGVEFGGFAFFGTVLSLPVFLYFIAKGLKETPGKYIDYCAPAVPVMLVFYRVGCFCAGCCGGITSTIAGFSFVWPTQLMECALQLLFLGFITNYETKIEGEKYPLYMIYYGFIRFFLEFVRATEKGFFMGLGIDQVHSLLSLVIGLVALYRLRKGVKNGKLAKG